MLSYCKRKYPLYNWAQIPIFLKHNEYIIDYYRVQLSWYDCLQSVFHWHNESLNIWTHLLGIPIMLVLCVIAFCTWLKDGQFLEVTVFLVYIFCASLLFLCSGIFHLLHCISEKMYCKCVKLDYTGISVMIIGTAWAPIYHMFCDTFWVLFYIIGITLLGALGLYVSWNDNFAKIGREVYRVAVFVLIGLYAVLPIFHSFVLNGAILTWICLLYTSPSPRDS
eukprot:TRINITY_DN8255_c0_g1_i2.p1 TRINITY_DN8255_c0_g1~~TRINITY_DN8255_c0_g1_i2.p1  ORF type:complete len:222 (+),score=5.38 TRINITY_DN8255_c0_g1_i2:34-699(+)